jgi:1-acyl-sn-glycerol-3-phosphate acyltransferase
MWLARLLPWIARAAAAVYYRVEYAGDEVPGRGPVLLVANHPNALLDPMLVAAAAGRPVRFLAKAPLFSDRRIGWLVAAVGAVPVHRRADDPALMGRNEETFRLVERALGDGDVVGLFPEGISHNQPTLQPLRTGAARIALGAAGATTGGAFPIVPVGLVFRRKDAFRSRALVLAGEPVRWDDLAARGVEDDAAVRALTGRIAEGLRAVTLNLERWEDRPLVECAVAIWEAERAVPPDAEDQVGRLEVTTRILAQARRADDGDALELAHDVDLHRRRLRRLGLEPADLRAELGFARGLSWAARRLLLVQPLVATTALAGYLLFWLPYRLTGWIVDRLRLPEDQRSTWKLLVGIVVYAAWVVALAIVAGAALGGWAALAALAGVPAVGLGGLVVRERWRGAWDDIRRYTLLRTRRPLMSTLRDRQRDLGARLDALVRTYAPGGAP